MHISADPFKHSSMTVPVLLSLAGQAEAVVVGVGVVSLPVSQLHPQRILALEAQLVQQLIAQPVLTRRIPETLQGQRGAFSLYVF